MRGKRSIVPVVADDRWGASILPGAPLQSTDAATPAATPAAQPLPPAAVPFAEQQPYVAPTQPYLAPPQPYGAPPQPFSAAPPQYGAAPDPRFGAVPDPRFAAPAPQFGGPPHVAGLSQLGAPPQYGPPQGYAPSPYAQPGGPQYFPPPPPPGGMPAAIKIVLCVVGGLFVVGILAAIAIPVFLSQKQRPANRAVSVPATVLGQMQLHTPELDNAAAQAIAGMQRPNAPWGLVSGSYFGTGGLPTFFVAAAKVNIRPTAADETALFGSLASSTGAALSPVGAGPFGGRMECGPLDAAGGTAMTQCYSIDNAAIVAIVVFESSPNQAALLARQIIGSVEH
ncbi:MAG: hypothetical protein QOC73_2370 [Actinomycetota bacterium]|nr:hypothetical protein [Actinomycetota bacterium]